MSCGPMNLRYILIERILVSRLKKLENLSMLIVAGLKHGNFIFKTQGCMTTGKKLALQPCDRIIEHIIIAFVQIDTVKFILLI